jgi:hypothetical protein
MSPFVGGRIAAKDFARIVHDTYDDFGHQAVAPLPSRS